MTSCLRSITRIWSSVLIDGDSPPCTQKVRSCQPSTPVSTTEYPCEYYRVPLCVLPSTPVSATEYPSVHAEGPLLSAESVSLSVRRHIRRARARVRLRVRTRVCARKRVCA